MAEALAINCEQKELHQYAGWCWLAAARCQGTVGNSICEINLLIKAGRQFLISNKKNNDIGCLSINQEDLQAAVNAFNHAITRCEAKEGFGVMSASLAMELALALGENSEGTEYLSRAIHTHPTVQAINILISYYIKQGIKISKINFKFQNCKSLKTINFYYQEIMYLLYKD